MCSQVSVAVRGMKDEYADRISLTVIEGTVEEIGEMVKEFDVGSHGLVGFVDGTVKYGANPALVTWQCSR